MTRIIVLFLALVVASGVAVFLIQEDDVAMPINQPLLGDFAAHLDKVQRIEIADANQQLLIAQLVDGQWQAKHIHSELQFPMDYDALVALIDSLQGAKQVEAKTQNPANYSRLGLRDIAEFESQARLVTLATPDKSYSILIGNTASNGFGSFVREPDNTQTWQLDEIIRLPDTQTSWLTNPVNLSELSDVFQVVRLGDESWQIVRDEPRESENGTANGRSGPFVLAGMRANEQLVFPNILQNSISAMLTVRYEDVVARAELGLADSNTQPVVINFDTAAGLLTASLYQIEDRYYVVYDSNAVQWVNQWAFKVTEFNFNQFAKKRSDFVEPMQTPEQNVETQTQRPIDEGEAPDN